MITRDELIDFRNWVKNTRSKGTIELVNDLTSTDNERFVTLRGKMFDVLNKTYKRLLSKEPTRL